MGSLPFHFDRADAAKVAKGFGIATMGAVITWAASNLIPTLTAEAADADGTWGRLGLLLAAAVASSLVNAGRKFIADNSTRTASGAVSNLATTILQRRQMRLHLGSTWTRISGTRSATRFFTSRGVLLRLITGTRNYTR